jgi:hypothetical protein
MLKRPPTPDSRRSSTGSVEIDADSKVILDSDGFSLIDNLKQFGLMCQIVEDQWVKSLRSAIRPLLHSMATDFRSAVLTIDHTMDFFQDGRNPDYVTRNLAAIIKCSGTFTINVTKVSISHDLQQDLYLTLHINSSESLSLLSGFTILPYGATFTSLSFKLGCLTSGHHLIGYPAIINPKTLSIRVDPKLTDSIVTRISKEVKLKETPFDFERSEQHRRSMDSHDWDE